MPRGRRNNNPNDSNLEKNNDEEIKINDFLSLNSLKRLSSGERINDEVFNIILLIQDNK